MDCRSLTGTAVPKANLGIFAVLFDTLIPKIARGDGCQPEQDQPPDASHVVVAVDDASGGW